MAIKFKEKAHKKIRQSSEERKNYQRLQDRYSVKIRLSLEEDILLKSFMKKEDWSCKSAFIRHKLFGENATERVKHLARHGDMKDLTIIVTEMEEWLETKETQAFAQVDYLINEVRNRFPDKAVLARIEYLLVEIRTYIPKYRDYFISVLEQSIKAKK